MFIDNRNSDSYVPIAVLYEEKDRREDIGFIKRLESEPPFFFHLDSLFYGCFC